LDWSNFKLGNTEPHDVVGEGGLSGIIVSAIDSQELEHILLRLNGEHEIWVPKNLLEGRPDGTYYVPLSHDQVKAVFAGRDSESLTSPIYILPVVAEKLKVGRRKIDTGAVRVHKIVHEKQETVDEPTIREEVEVQHVPVNRVIEKPMEIRREGDTLVIPIVEEIIVIEKRLVLKEEVQITSRPRIVHDPLQVTLKQEEAVIERIDESSQSVH
jgi:uncharacterized protein (TIGR02271 family)